jgi:hypothetical protein
MRNLASELLRVNSHAFLLMVKPTGPSRMPPAVAAFMNGHGLSAALITVA